MAADFRGGAAHLTSNAIAGLRAVEGKRLTVQYLRFALMSLNAYPSPEYAFCGQGRTIVWTSLTQQTEDRYSKQSIVLQECAWVH